MPPALRRCYTAVSASAHDLDLHLTIDAVTRYTLDFSCRFDDPEGYVADPICACAFTSTRAWLRRAGSRPRHETLRQLMKDSRGELDRRWSKNIMLGKWLDYLYDMGHRFRSSPLVPA
jgi:uncharacterized protein YqiB (DUF1249 family)